MMRVIINGINGKMGQWLIEACAQKQIEIVAGIDAILNPDASYPFPVYTDIQQCKEKADALIDFSRPAAIHSILDYSIMNNLPAVIATTGFSDQEKAYINNCAKRVPVFFSANMSMGVNLQVELAKTAAKFFGDRFDIEIIEKHHNMKVDSPSGTALLLADGINSVFEDSKEYEFGRHTKTQKRQPQEIGIHAVRGGTIVGEHQILFIGDYEVLEITHKAESRQVFAFGALRTAEFLVGKAPALYDMSHIVNETN